MNTPMTDLNPSHTLQQCIQKVATGPEYSKDLSHEEAYHAMRYILSGQADPVQTAVYLIALRMKRETEAENRGTLQAIIESAQIQTAKVPSIIDLSDPYDGYVRGIPASSFVPALLAAMGEYAVIHGVNQVGPKYGATHHKILKAAGLNVNLSPEAACQQLESIGWTYLDQSQFAPALHDLIPLRQRIIKRQILTTVENLVGPIRGAEQTHCMSGYVHTAYPPIYEYLAHQAGFTSALFVRGVEGGIIPSLQQAGKLFSYQGDSALTQWDLNPAQLGIEATTRAIPLPDDLSPLAANEMSGTINSDALAARAAQLGLAALGGEKGLMYDSLVYASAIVLTHLGRYAALTDAAVAVRAVLDSGRALAVFKAAA